MKILITGGTGLIGKLLGIELVRKGHQLVGITRSQEDAEINAPYPATWVEADLNKDVPDLSAHKIDGVIHLAGENVGEKNWTDSQKEKIKESRRLGTQNLLSALKNQKPRFFIGASAIGYYNPTQGDFFATEESPRGEGFLSEVTELWEQASEDLPQDVRRVIYRLGVVLSTQGGALPKMLFPAQIFASSSIGSGYQWMSWVHILDVVRAFIFAVETDHLDGTFNLVAPHTAQQKDLAKHIALRLRSLSGPPVPSFMIKTLMGEQASLALDSVRVSGRKLLNAGFDFDFPTLARAMKDLLQKWKNGCTEKIYHQYFPLPRERVFQFFSEAKNLEKITPDLLSFEMRGTSTEKVGKGTLINYKLKIHGVPVYWRTQIKEWNPPYHFTDVQLKGPYTHWEHTHTFEDLGEGTLMTDNLIYKVPVGLLGRLTTQAWIDGDVEHIFKYRRQSVGQYL